MLIVQAGTPDYAEMMDECARRCGLLGYRYARHELKPDPIDFGGDTPPCTFKPGMLEGIPTDGTLALWLDADAFPVAPLDDLDCMESDEYDVIVTLREPEYIGKSQPITNYIQAGVVGFCGWHSAYFVERWQQVTVDVGNDQLALNEIVGHGWTDQEWLESYGKTIETPDGFFVLILSAAVWNFGDWNRRPPPDAKILHFKRGWRALNGPDWWKRELERYPDPIRA